MDTIYNVYEMFGGGDEIFEVYAEKDGENRFVGLTDKVDDIIAADMANDFDLVESLCFTEAGMSEAPVDAWDAGHLGYAQSLARLR